MRRVSFRFLLAASSIVFASGVTARVTVYAQPPAQTPPAPPAPGETAGQHYKNVQIFKDIPAEQLPLAMQYITASLGVGCDFCHVTGPGGAFDKDDKDTKKRARDMIKMVSAINTTQFEGRPTIGCMSCHNGRSRPSRTPALAVEMTPEEAAAFRAGRGGRGGPGGFGAPGGPGRGPGAPGGAQAPGAAGPGQGAPGAAAPQPGGATPGGPGRGGEAGGGRGQQPPPTETLDQVLGKYLQALGGRDALAKMTSRVLTGTAGMRDLQSPNITVQETSSGAYRIDIASQPNPTVRVVSGNTGWSMGGFNNMVRDLDAFQMQQAARLADFTLPLHMQEKYSALAVSRYTNVDGKPAIMLTGRPYPGVTEQLHFDRESGLLLRRNISTSTPLGPLPEQIDYSDYRDVNGIKVPFAVRYATWSSLMVEKLTDVKFNAPVEADIFQKPPAK